MIEGPTLWGLIPLFVFVLLAFMKYHPVVALLIATISGAILTGSGLVTMAFQIEEGLGEFLAYIGLLIMAGGGLGKITEKTGVAKYIVKAVVYKIGIDTQNKALLGAMASTVILSGALGTFTGASAIIMPVVMPIMANLRISSSSIAIIFQGAGITGLLLGPFTPPMVTFMEVTELSYWQILLYGSLPVSLVMWIVTFIFIKIINPRTIKNFSYTEEDLVESGMEKNDYSENNKIVKQTTIAFLITMIALIIYGILIQGGSSFAIVIIISTAIVTGLVGRLNTKELAETFFEGAQPLIWLFFQFILFTPFINFIEELGGFEAVADLMLPIIESGGNFLLTMLAAITGAVGIPGAAVAQTVILDEVFGDIFYNAGVPISIWVLVLIIGSQMTEFLYPLGDTLGAMGIARSRDLRTMIFFGVVMTVLVVSFLALRSLFV